MCPLLWKSSITLSAPSYTLHRFPEKQPGVFLGMCEQPSTLSVLLLLPSLSLPLSWHSSLRRCPNINICHQNGREEISLSPSPHHSSHSSLSINCLFRGYSFFESSLPLSHPPTYPLYLLHSFCLLCLPLSRLFAVFSGWLLTPPCWLASVGATYPKWDSVYPPSSSSDCGPLSLANRAFWLNTPRPL